MKKIESEDTRTTLYKAWGKAREDSGYSWEQAEEKVEDTLAYVNMLSENDFNGIVIGAIEEYFTSVRSRQDGYTWREILSFLQWLEKGDLRNG